MKLFKDRVKPNLSLPNQTDTHDLNHLLIHQDDKKVSIHLNLKLYKNKTLKKTAQIGKESLKQIKVISRTYQNLQLQLTPKD